MKAFLTLGFVAILIQACTTSPVRRHEIATEHHLRVCAKILDGADWTREERLLEVTQRLHDARCHRKSLRLGNLLRERLRDKEYSVSSEVLSLLGPEQMTQTYVLESHERAYLAILMAQDHWALGEREAAKVELRRAGREVDALLYNYGRDDVTHVLLAGLWEKWGEPETAAPYWRRLGLETFAESGERSPIRLYSVGRFEGYDWSFGGPADAGGIYHVRSKSALPERCVSATGALVPIDDWVRKMQLRHAHAYHPLLNVKSYVRFPVGVGFGLLLGGTGVAVAVGGCAAVADQGGSGEGCRMAVELGAHIAAQAPGVFNYAAQPDLRHWEHTPVAFLVTRQPDLRAEACAANVNAVPFLTSPESDRTLIASP